MGRHYSLGGTLFTGGGTLFTSEYCPGGHYSPGDSIPSDTGFFADLYFRELLTERISRKNIFAIRTKPDHTHVGALREEGVAQKNVREIYFRD